MEDLSEIIKAAIWGEKAPKVSGWNKWVHQNLSFNHCEECLKLDGCWFAKDKTPKWPHHTFCHCVLIDVPYDTVLKKSTAIAPFSKFDPYLFDRDNKYGHKKQIMFESWGYNIEDSKWLQEEIEKQGLNKYISGDYELGKLNENGQRISIRVEIMRRDKFETVSFVTGWMVCQNGKIKLVTPYGGK